MIKQSHHIQSQNQYNQSHNIQLQKIIWLVSFVLQGYFKAF